MNRKRLDDNICALACGEIGLLHSLGIEGIPVFSGSNMENSSAFYSRYSEANIHFPDYESEQFIEKLCEFGAGRRKKTVLVTDDDQAVLAISRNREKLAKYFLFLLPDQSIVEALQDKQLFYGKAKEFNLPVPATLTISSFKELGSVANDLPYPCIVKPVNKEDWWHKDFKKEIGPYQKAFRCSSREELFRLYRKIYSINPKIILQESIEGPDEQHYSVNMYIDNRGDFKGYYIYQKMRMCPPSAGRGSFFVTVWEKEVLERAKEISSKLGIKGLVNLQFKRDIHSYDLKLIEMEPRLSVSSFLGPAAEANLAALYYRDLVGGRVPNVNGFRPGVKYSDPIRDVKAFLEYVKQGRLSFWEWLKSYKGKVVYNGYLLKDPYPILMSLWFIIINKFTQTDSNTTPQNGSG